MRDAPFTSLTGEYIPAGAQPLGDVARRCFRPALTPAWHAAGSQQAAVCDDAEHGVVAAPRQGETGAAAEGVSPDAPLVWIMPPALWASRR